MSDDDFNNKNWVWVADGDDLFTKGYIIDYLPDKKCKVNVKNNNKESVITIDSDKLESCNPTKFNKCNDMAELTHLNEPSVVYNLYLRYNDNLIYTYSGLFLVAINPYKSLDIYNDNYLKNYDNDNLPPHIFSIAQVSFNNLIKHKKNQSILVTGESGAGKTENTKKIIQYLSSISKSQDNSTIDEKILQANPILESFGNAKTLKNNNSSRFGKFIKIYFNNNLINGADIDYYLLEKSRVINQSSEERNYHIFYQVLKGFNHLEKFSLSSNVNHYKYLNNINVPNVNDTKEFNGLMESFNIIGLNHDQIHDIIKILAIILHLGNLTFKNFKSERAIFTDDSPVDIVTNLLSIDKSEFVNNLLNPKVKAGKEFVTKVKKPAEVKYAIDSLAKFLYEKLFIFIINTINSTLNDNMSDDNFVGVLDIAGFEIFDENSFEQLCINYTNEKLQQFFNHHSFILEQSEYLREDIQWDYIDFGKDLQPTIDLIENTKPMGILKLLDEECIMPKSSDQSFLEKLFQNWGNDAHNPKHDKFKPNKFKSGFIINHYAGQVEYNVDNWLNKNTDPINENLIQVIKNSENDFINQLVIMTSVSSTEVESPKKLKSLSSKHKFQLNNLMDQLSSTEPHFVRCILPNLHKKPNKFDKQLVLHQLRCNGVLEGIRITRAGYPNKMTFDEFFQRYSILNTKEVYTKTAKTNCELILKYIQLDLESYKIGITKLFFKNGILGKLEELRDVSLKGIFTNFKTIIRGNSARLIIKKEILKLQSSQVVAKNFIKVDKSLRENLWFKLFVDIKPLLEDSVKVLNSKEVNDNLKQMSLKLKDSEKLNKNYEVENKRLSEKHDNLENEIISINNLISEKDKALKDLKADENKSKKKIDTFESTLKKLKEENSELIKERSKLTDTLKKVQREFDELTTKFDKITKDYDLSKDELTSSKDISGKYEKEKSDHSKSIELLKSQKERHDKLKDTYMTLLNTHNDLKSGNTDFQSKFDDLVSGKNQLQKEYDSISKQLKDIKTKNDTEIGNLNKSISTLKGSSTDKQNEISKLNLKINQLKSDNDELNNKLNNSNSEFLNLKKQLSDSNKQLTDSKSKLESLDELSQKLKATEKEISSKKEKESIKLQEIEDLRKQLSQSSNENRASLTQIESLKVELDQNQRAKNDYSKKIVDSNNKIKDLEGQLRQFEREKENYPPAVDTSMMNDYANIKLKLNEVNASLRKEKFENKKMEEEINILKNKISISPYSSPSKSARQSVAMGEDLSVKNGNSILTKQIDDLKFKLEQEESNSQRAENYAIELQKKLNKLQNTRGLNSNIDFEKKYRESQGKISELEDKFGKLFEANSPNGTTKTMTKSESFGRSGILNKTLNNANQDFVKIYNDITQTLKATREELTGSKSEILRLKSLLRESEDELYQIKRETFKASISNYENELARLKVKQDNLTARNSDLSQSVEVYKIRSDEYFKKLELAESAVTISKRHEDQAVKELEGTKTELKLAKEEAKTSQILIKDINKENSSLQSTIKEKNFDIEKLNNEINNLMDKIKYNKDTYENRELNERLKQEVRDIHNELNFKLETETKLIKENKQLQIDNETLTKQKTMLEEDFEVKLNKIDELEAQESDLSKKLRGLENEKAINERKISNLTKQVGNLKDLINDITQQRDELIEVKDELEEQNMVLNQKLEEKTLTIESNESDMRILRNHLDNQRLESSEIQNELNQSKISTNDDITNYQKLKRDNLVLSEENDTLVRINDELRSKTSTLEDKLYNNEQIKYWENKLKEMNRLLDDSRAENFGLNKSLHNYKSEVKKFEIKYDNDSKLIKKYNDENFEYQSKINHYKSTLDILHNENLEKDLQLKSLEKESIENKEHTLLLEKEVLQLRDKLGIV